MHSVSSCPTYRLEKLIMIRRLFALFTLLTSAAMAAPTATPNILFLFCDDLSTQVISAYGEKRKLLETPGLDRIAKEGVLFKNTFCTTSLCSPSRASILSGLYAHPHGVTNNFTEYPATMPRFPGLLHDAGYATAYFGKYHMGEDNDEPRPGFDTFVTHKGQGKYFDTEFNINGTRREVVKGYYTTVVTDMTLDWLKQQKAEKPWCMFLGHKAPHSFYTPEPKYEHSFDDVRVPYPASAFQIDDKPTWIKDRQETWHGIYGPLFEWRKKFPDARPEAVIDFENMVHGYWGTVLSVDDSVARIVKYLQTSGQWDNTVVVFMGDNGTGKGMADRATIGGKVLSGMKGTMLECGGLVPMIANWPGKTPAGKVSADLIDSSDFLTTFAELSGGALPKDTIFDGHSMAPQLRGEAGTPREWIFNQLAAMWYVRDAKWKLNEKNELYDMSEAPFAKNSSLAIIPPGRNSPPCSRNSIPPAASPTAVTAQVVTRTKTRKRRARSP